MNDNIKIGADIHAGDGGYSIGTQEKYDEFAKGRNQSLGKMRIEELMYRAGLTAQGCWDEMGDYEHKAIERFAELIVRECAGLFPNVYVEIETDYGHTPVIASDYIKKHFGVKE